MDLFISIKEHPIQTKKIKMNKDQVELMMATQKRSKFIFKRIFSK